MRVTLWFRGMGAEWTMSFRFDKRPAGRTAPANPIDMTLLDPPSTDS